jgi:hypothetical protein
MKNSLIIMIIDNFNILNGKLKPFFTVAFSIWNKNGCKLNKEYTLFSYNKSKRIL